MNALEPLYASLASGSEALSDAARTYLAEDVQWSVAHPVNDLRGLDATGG